MQSSLVFANATFEEILDDLSSRFIINVPTAELSSVERICFQVEQAHWFYEDFIRELKPELPSFQLKTFSARIFKHCPLLHQWAHEHERAYADFMQYRFRIPVCGAIILNAALDKCVLVKGWSSKSGWGFPKGKINQDEEYDCCAIREVLEETGYDIEPLLKTQDFIELTMREQLIRLYIIQGVPEETEFLPRTRKEISQISWIKLDDLPTYKTHETLPGSGKLNYVKSGSYRFYMVVPFMNKLRQFVNQRKKAMRKLEKSRTSPNRLPDPPSLKPAESALKSILGVSNKDSDSVYSVDSKSSSPSPHPKKNARQNPKKEKAKQPVQKQKQPRSRQQGKQEGAYPSEKTEEMTFHQPVPTSSGQDMLQKLFNSQQYMEQPTFAQNQYSQEPLNQQQQFMQQLFHQQQTKSQSPSETPPSAHRASFVEELLKSKAGMQSPSTEVSSSNSSVIGENARRNSLLNVLQGRASAEPPTTNPLQALLNGNAPIVRANYE